VCGATALVGSADLVEAAPWLSWRVPPVPIWWTVAYYSAAAGVVLRPSRVWLGVAGGVAAAALLVIVSAPAWSAAARSSDLLRLVVLDVGQGDALLLRLPTGQAMLIDAGGTAGPFDIGGRLVTPAAWAQGVRRLEWLAVTHPDQDHIGGALSVASDLKPREIWEGIPVPRNGPLGILRDFAARHGVIWRSVRAGESLAVADVRVDVLHPGVPDWERQRARNDDSIVLRVRYGAVELLLPGDAGAEFESRAVEDAPRAGVRVLKAAHHGSRTSSADRFVRAYRPDIVLVSAGRGNLFGHPARDVLARFASAGAAVFRTDEDGAISLETDGRTVRVRTHGGKHWSAGVLSLF
jgi:competence protein ComEC